MFVSVTITTWRQMLIVIKFANWKGDKALRAKFLIKLNVIKKNRN
jgi:hypothetical protein